MESNDDLGERLWWTATVLLSVLVVAIAYYDGIYLALATWAVLFFILMIIRPG